MIRIPSEHKVNAVNKSLSSPIHFCSVSLVLALLLIYKHTNPGHSSLTVSGVQNQHPGALGQLQSTKELVNCFSSPNSTDVRYQSLSFNSTL